MGTLYLHLCGRDGKHFGRLTAGRLEYGSTDSHQKADGEACDALPLSHHVR